jgi:hypothetical protein
MAMIEVAGAGRGAYPETSLSEPPIGRGRGSPEDRRSFCDDLRHRQAAHLQGATQHRADHGEGADQQEDCDQLACALTHRIKQARRCSNGEPHRQKERGSVYPIAWLGTSERDGGVR